MELLRYAASVEQYSKRPLAIAVVMAAKQEKIETLSVDKIREKPGEGLKGRIAGKLIEITGRKKVTDRTLPLPELLSGLECLMFVEGRYTAAFCFHDAPRKDSASFIEHLKPKHGVRKVMLVSGDRESELRYRAESVGITELHPGKSSEEKVAIVKEETAEAETLSVGDGINDAPALLAATVGAAFGSQNDITTEAAQAVVLATALGKIDGLMHIGQRMRRIALQSALGEWRPAWLECWRRRSVSCHQSGTWWGRS